MQTSGKSNQWEKETQLKWEINITTQIKEINTGKEEPCTVSQSYIKNNTNENASFSTNR